MHLQSSATRLPLLLRKKKLSSKMRPKSKVKPSNNSSSISRNHRQHNLFHNSNSLIYQNRRRHNLSSRSNRSK